jgi:hypothetical protein
MAQPVQTTIRRTGGAALLAIPLLAVLVLAGVGLAAGLRASARAERVRGLVPFTGALTTLVDQLQQERELSTTGKPARPKLAEARAAVDGAVNDYRDAAVRVDSSDRDRQLHQRLDAGLTRLSELPDLRASVEAADPLTVFRRYTAIVGDLLAVGGEIGQNEAGQDAELLRAVTAATAFSRAKELADREHVAAAQAEAAGALDPTERTRLAVLGGRQDALLDQFAALASREQLARYRRALPAAEVDRAARLRRTVLEGGSGASGGSAARGGADLAGWSEVATAKVERMRDVELGLMSEVGRLAGLAQRAAARRLLAYAVVGFLAASALVVLLVLAPGRSRRSRAADPARDPAPFLDPATRVRDPRTPVIDPTARILDPRTPLVDPGGQILDPTALARAPGTPGPHAPGAPDPHAPGTPDPHAPGAPPPHAPGTAHPHAPGAAHPHAPGGGAPEREGSRPRSGAREAVHSPMESAQAAHGHLGGAAGPELADLARRSQDLVDQQLELLDQVARDQADPRLPGRLLQVDRLAVRARRNAHNLIVLAGGEPGDDRAQPAPLAEVVSQAVRDNPDAHRVDLAVTDDLLVPGWATDDLASLLAELVDNATAFSAPETRVRVGGQKVGSGYVLEVEDRGLGMTDEELVAVNRRLTGGPGGGSDREQRLGTWVAGRLAARHDVRVQLRRSAYGGVTALVFLPQRLVDAPPPVTPPAPEEPQDRRQDGQGSDAALAGTPMRRYMTQRAPERLPEQDQPLPKRAPHASLAPDLAGAGHPGDPAPPPARSPEQVRNMLTRYRSGLERGRAAASRDLPDDPDGDLSA